MGGEWGDGGWGNRNIVYMERRSRNTIISITIIITQPAESPTGKEGFDPGSALLKVDTLTQGHNGW